MFKNYSSLAEPSCLLSIESAQVLWLQLLRHFFGLLPTRLGRCPVSPRALFHHASDPPPDVFVRGLASRVLEHLGSRNLGKQLLQLVDELVLRPAHSQEFFELAHNVLRFVNLQQLENLPQNEHRIEAGVENGQVIRLNAEVVLLVPVPFGALAPGSLQLLARPEPFLGLERVHQLQPLVLHFGVVQLLAHLSGFFFQLLILLLQVDDSRA